MGLLARICIHSARNLPIMDTLTQSADPYVIVSHHSKIIAKTPIVKKTLNPEWNYDFRYELSDPSELQDYVLEFKVWDHDIVSSDNVIGTVLMVVEEGFEGWMPICDSLKGNRGELYFSISLESLGNVNPRMENSENVKIYSCNDLRFFPNVELGGMVEELLVDEDPEHTWRDNFRSSRISNEQRQNIFYKLSGKLRRKMGKKAFHQGYNSIIGYHEKFDLEEDNGIIIRGFGTLALIVKNSLKNNSLQNSLMNGDASSQHSESPSNRSPRTHSSFSQGSVGNTMFSSPNDVNTWKKAEVQITTLKQFERNRIKRIGGLITAKSIKVCHKLEKNRKQLAKIHDSWWNELRDELKSHARTLRCNHIIGYEENMYIHRDVCILWVIGTAAVLRARPKQKKHHCKIFHIQNNDNPFIKNITPIQCEMCGDFPVPEILFATVEPSEEIVTRGESVHIEARIIRAKKFKSKEEELAKSLSKILPFIEFDLHKQLIFKMKLYGMNVGWGYKMDYTINQDNILCTCSIQACHSVALPRPIPLEFHRIRKILDQEDEQMFTIQTFLERVSIYNIKKMDNSSTSVPIVDSSSDSDSSTDSEDDQNREEDPSIAEIRDDTDDDQMACLLTSAYPSGISSSSLLTRIPPGCLQPISYLQTISITKRFKFEPPEDKQNQYLTALYNDMNRELAYRVQPFSPCLLSGYKNKFILIDREIQIQSTATAILLQDSQDDKLNHTIEIHTSSSDTDSDDKFEDIRPPLLYENLNTKYRKIYETTMSEKGALSNYDTSTIHDDIFTMDHDNKNNLEEKELNEEKESLDERDTKDLHSYSASSSGDLLEKNNSQLFITNLYFVPGYQVKQIHHRVYVHFLKETDNVSDPANFLEEMYSQAKFVLRNQVIGSHGNAILGFNTSEHSIILNANRRQAYGLITCFGDMADIVPQRSGSIGSEIISNINLCDISD